MSFSWLFNEKFISCENCACLSCFGGSLSFILGVILFSSILLILRTDSDLLTLMGEMECLRNYMRLVSSEPPPDCLSSFRMMLAKRSLFYHYFCLLKFQTGFIRGCF